MELRPLKDRDYLLKFVAEDKTNDFTYEQAEREFFSEGHFVFGYEVYNKGKRQAVAYSLVYDGFYSLDGYNEGHLFFLSVAAGKAVVEKLFKDYTDVVFTEHDKENIMVTLLCRKIGFIDFEVYNGRNVMVMEER